MASVSISCPSCSATDGVVRNGKALPDISAILLSLP
ncbi:IS1 family transposase [Escherichia coli]|nr:IS1 family transposase [Escherichia coli]